MTCETLLKKEIRKIIFRLKFNKILNINKMFNRFLRFIIGKLISKIIYLF